MEKDRHIRLPEDQDVRLAYTKFFFEENGIFKWIADFKLGTAGYRDTIDMKDFFSTDAPYNGHTIMIVAEAMARIYNRKGYGSIHLGGEVRRYTPEIITLIARVFASHGITVHLNAEKGTTPICTVHDVRLWNVDPIVIGAGSTLSFWHRYQFENPNYDGAVLEISTDGGGIWSDLGSYITANGYNGIISTRYNNPLGGRNAWMGDLTVWTQVEVELSAFAGQSVNIGWRFGSDSSVSDLGWYIDDVEITCLNDDELMRVTRKFGLLFQGAALFDSMTVAENVRFGVERYTRLSEEEICERVTESLGLVGLNGAEGLMPHELSGGLNFSKQRS